MSSEQSRIHYARPSITSLEIGYATDAATNGWGEQCYDYIHRFEDGFRTHVGSKYAIATSSGTGALHLGMAALGIGPGAEVILADVNWIASAAPIIHLGATPVLVDIDEATWCLDPAMVEAAITPRTRAILAVHLYGNLCPLDALLDIGKAHGIPVIEDAAEAIGSVWHGRKAGSVGAFGAFSFHGTKTITTGEGGMLVTDDENLYESALTLSNHGRARGEARQFWPERIGYKYKMSNIQAAIGCGQLERIEELVAAKRCTFNAYRSALAHLPLQMNPESPGTTNGYWMPTIVVDDGINIVRPTIMRQLQEGNVDARTCFWPLSSLGLFERRTATPVSHSVSARALNLPSYYGMCSSDISRVCGIVTRCMDGVLATR